MTKVVIDMTMSLDGFVEGPDGAIPIFDWYMSGPSGRRATSTSFIPSPV